MTFSGTLVANDMNKNLSNKIVGGKKAVNLRQKLAMCSLLAVVVDKYRQWASWMVRMVNFA